MIGTLAVDKWAVTFGTARKGLGGLRPVWPYTDYMQKDNSERLDRPYAW